MVKFLIQAIATVLLLASSTSAHTQLDFDKLATDAKNYLTPSVTATGTPSTEVRPLHPLVAGIEFGGTGNNAYEYRDAVEPGEIVRGVTIRAGKRVGGVGIIHQDLSGNPKTLLNGARAGGGKSQTLDLGPGEYIKTIEAHTGEKDGRKGISFVKFTTNLGNSVSGGTPTDDIGTETAEEGYQIGGFSGKSGDEIDSVAAIWATLKA
ncbi:hypothetical protein P3T76_002635 [Phytophthora citrophthora]|uniref:Jacalin-type lectin domain-containing protein n=1 Tax=Phytophthora citrophthora TaxID=4793 RepID=A0AAD9GVL4_9STRA|nr:hypothetical protein P3T76_002635 [Phytophthora citrophthora]